MLKSIESVIFVVFMTAALGLSLWIPIMLPLAIGGFSLLVGLLMCRYEVRQCKGSVLYMIVSMLLNFVVFALIIHSAFQFPAELSGELFYRDILPFMKVSFQ